MSHTFGNALLRGSALALVIKALGAVAALGSHVLIARTTTPATFGLYLFVLGWVSIAALGCRFGLDTLIVRWTAHYRALGELAAVGSFRRWSRNRLWSQIAAVLAVSGVLLVTLRGQISNAMWHAAWAAMPLTVVMAWNAYFQALAQGLGRAWAFAPEQLFRPLLFILLLLGYVVICNASLAVWQLFFLSTTAAAGGLALAFFGSRTEGSEAEAGRTQRQTWRNALWPLFFIASANVVLSQTDVLMLGVLTTKAEVGIYGAAARIVLLTTFGLAAVNTYMAPEISRLYAGARMAELQQTVTSSARLVVVFTVIVVTFLVVFVDWILALFGPEYLAAANALRILLIGQLVSALAGSVGYLQTMTGQERQAAALMMAAALVNIALNVLLIPRYGINGAAVATASALIVWRLVAVVLVRRRIGIRSTVL